MTEQQKAYHEHQQKNVIKTAEQQNAYKEWLNEIDALDGAQRVRMATRQAANTAEEFARDAEREVILAQQHEGRAWLKYEFTKEIGNLCAHGWKRQ